MTHFVRQQPGFVLGTYQSPTATAVEELSARGVRAAVNAAIGGYAGTQWCFNQQASGASLGTALRYAEFDDTTYGVLNGLGAFAGFDIQTSIASQQTDTFIPSLWNPGLHSEAWLVCGDSIAKGDIDGEPISQQSWAQCVLSANRPAYFAKVDGEWTNQNSFVGTRRCYAKASRIAYRVANIGRFAYVIPGNNYTASGGGASLSWDIAPGLIQGFPIYPNQTIGFLLQYGANDWSWIQGGFNLFGSPISGPPFSVVTNADTPSGSTLPFSTGATNASQIANGYQITGLNISQAPGGTPLAPAPSANTYVTANSSAGGTISCTISNAVLGDVPSGTSITFIPPNFIDNYARPAIARIRSMFPNRAKTKIVFAVPIGRAAQFVASANTIEVPAFADYLIANQGTGGGQLDFDAIADTRLLPMFNCTNYVVNCANTTYYDADKTHPNALGMQILGGGLLIDGVTPGYSPGSWAYAMEHAMGRI